jgi:hypothetical protein
VFLVNKNVLTETWGGNGLSYPIYNRNLLSKYVFLVDGKSIYHAKFICSDFDKNILVLHILLCSNLVFLQFIYKPLG